MEKREMMEMILDVLFEWAFGEVLA